MSERFPKQLTRALLLTFVGSVLVGGVSGGIAGAYLGLAARGGGAAEPGILEPFSREEVVRREVVQEESSLAEMIKRVSPSVVSIVITKEVAVGNGIGDLWHLGPFGFDFGPPNTGQTEKRQVGGGSGFIVSDDGLIVTNRHVVSDAEATYTVVLSDGRKLDAAVLARDTVIDLALLKIDGSGLPELALGDSDSLELGETVVAIGNALGEFSNSVTRGIVSGINRRIVAGGSLAGSEVIEEAIQTDAAINPGNSGGPLLTLDGLVVGVNTAVSREGQSVGFAIPINAAKQSIASVREHGRIIRPFIGVRYSLITSEFAKEHQLPRDHGALIVRGGSPGQVAIVPGSPAEKAGLEENDIILEVDGVRVDDAHSLIGLIGRRKVGDTLSLKVLHQGEEKTVALTLAELPPRE